MNSRTQSFLAPRITAGVVAFGAFLAFVPTGRSAPWKSKDWTQWTNQECMQIATDSPWADTYREHEVYQGNDTSSPLPVTAVISSSLIIRQVFVRQQQLLNGQSALLTVWTRQQASALLQRRAEACLSESFADKIVVTVSGAFPEEFKTPPELEVSGKKYSPIDDSEEDPVGKACSSHMLIAGLRAAVYEYPRFVNGRPIIGPNDKKIVITTPSTWARNFVFNPHKMIYKGKPDF